MKSPSKFTWSALVTLSAIGVVGMVGACGDDGGTNPPPPPPPPLAAPTNLTATLVSETQVDLSWTDNSTAETGFAVESCTGTGCTNFAAAGTVAANVTTFSAMGLTPDTVYNFRVKAFNATDSSTFSDTESIATRDTTTPPPVGPMPILVGAGEITSCNAGAANLTATLIQGMLNDTNVTVFTTGNNLDDTLAANASYEACFDGTWGQFKNRTFYAVGNQDFRSTGTSEVYEYFGDRIGSPEGWYSFDRGNWHIVVLNTSTWQHGVNRTFAAGPGTQLEWLTNDLAATTKPCIMAISWDRRLYTSGTGTLGMNFNMNELMKVLYAAGLDVLVSGKDHVYERFPQTNVDGVPDPNGFRQFIVGTGGRTLWNTKTPTTSNVEAQAGLQQGAHGVIKFTLGEASYKWEFVPTTPGGFTDSGETACN